MTPSRALFLRILDDGVDFSWCQDSPLQQFTLFNLNFKLQSLYRSRQAMAMAISRTFSDIIVGLQITTGRYRTKHGQAIRTDLIDEFTHIKHASMDCMTMFGEVANNNNMN